MGKNWDDVWESIRKSKVEEFYSSRKLTIFAVASILNLPKETVRRKVENLRKKKLISYSTKEGLLPTDKIEEAIKPYAIKELHSLSKFLQALKKHKSLDQMLSL